jgi:CRISPR/Cas system-associated exonuclease Cas4 (RecB family)
MSLHDLPQEIKDYIMEQAGGSYTKRDGSIDCTELLYCMRKAWLRRKYQPPKSLESAFYLFRGKLMDREFSKLFKRNQIRVTHRVPNGPVIVGKFDWIENGVVVDLKTTKTLYYVKKAKEEHEKQVKFYAYCDNRDHGRLEYMDFGGAEVFEVDCSDAADVVKELEARAILYHECLINDVAPRPEGMNTERQWECKNCECKDYCDEIELLKAADKFEEIDKNKNMGDLDGTA